MSIESNLRKRTRTEQYDTFIEQLTPSVFGNPYIAPNYPTYKQALFLALDNKEILYGGAAGGGKSIALLMAALQYVDQPEYNAIIFRKTFQDLALPNALLDVSKQWLMPTDAHWNEVKKVWTFPSGATLSFGYLQTANDKFRYQGSEYHAIMFDELTQFEEEQYLYLFSRLRKKKDCQIPLRMRAASNPGGIGHEFVFDRFIGDCVLREDYFEKQDRAFVPALMNENPHLDPSYDESLNNLDAVTRAQLRNGDWYVRPSGGVFDRHWFDQWFNPDDPPKFDEQIISADLAFKEKQEADYTVYQCWARLGSHYYLVDQERGHWGYPEAKRQFLNFCARNPNAHLKLIEDKASGISLIQDLKRSVSGIVPYNPGSKSKLERAQIIAPYAEARDIYLPRFRDWVRDYLNELVAFPTALHDDQVDATTQALIRLQAHRNSYRFSSL